MLWLWLALGLGFLAIVTRERFMDRVCAGCDKQIVAGPRERNKRRWCSESCRTGAWAAKNRERVRASRRALYARRIPVVHTLTCVSCRGSFSSDRLGRKYCSRPCAYRQAYLSRRARHVGAEWSPYSVSDVVEQGDGACGICRTPIDMTLAYPNPDASSIDHVVPLSLGGSDTLENVQLAHLGCNWTKGNRITG